MAAHGFSYYSVGRAPALPEGLPTEASEGRGNNHTKYE
jgi:hypothetical protein